MRARSGLTRVALGAVAVAVGLAGCGGSSSSSSGTPSGGSSASAAATASPAAPGSTAAPAPAPATKAARTHLPKVGKLQLSSVAVTGGVLASRYTCDGSDVSPPLQISGVPPGTAELALDVLDLEPVNGAIYFDWAVAGLSPNLHSIAAGKLPPGAVVGVNSGGRTGYSLCPPKGKSVTYVAVVFALPHRLSAQKGFDAAALRREALLDANYEKFLVFAYTRK